MQNKLTPEEFHSIADEYISKLGEIAKKNDIQFLSAIVTKGVETDETWYFPALDWTNMDEFEVLKSLNCLHGAIDKHYMKSPTE